ncbi:MAG TPA: mannitol-1-phosphate 5-dehydrogenase [Armatimonadota bacterium]|jgi:mannitol-1-phosphate 5-dehydrogenase
MKRIVQFGAGNIGRSLVGQLFARAGYEVVFVDAVPAIVEALNERHKYQVVVKDRVPETLTVSGVRGILARDEEAVAQAVAEADLIGTAVGPKVLPFIYPNLARGLARRNRPVSIILCENLRNARLFVRDGLQEYLPADFAWSERVGLVETSIGKMVPIMPAAVRERDPLEVWAEAYNQIIADGEAFLGPPPQVEGLVLKRHFRAYVDRKLFIHNLGHATAAYHGYLAGCRTLADCMALEGVRAEAQGAMRESAEAVHRQYPEELSREDLAEHVEDLLRRFDNPALGDTVFRVGRDLTRKLESEDRLVGALRLARRHQVECPHILRAIAAALLFRATDEAGLPFPADREAVDRARDEGPEVVLREVCGLCREGDAPVVEEIARHYRSLGARS